MSDGARRFVITFDVNVIDEERFMAYARKRVRERRQDTLESLTSGREEPIERALLEALLFSNENPSPGEYGIEFPGLVHITEPDRIVWGRSLVQDEAGGLVSGDTAPPRYRPSPDSGLAR